MTTIIEVNQRFLFMSDVLTELGNIPAERVRLHPSPGTATIADFERLTKSDGLYELIDNTLVRKPMGSQEGLITPYLALLIHPYILKHHLGLFYGESALYQFESGVILSPDLSFISWDCLPSRQRPVGSILSIVPSLVIEVLSQSNTAVEMRRKRVIYFGAGVECVWEVDIELRTLTAYHNADEYVRYTRNDTVVGEPMLPGFTLSLSELFSMYDIQG